MEIYKLAFFILFVILFAFFAKKGSIYSLGFIVFTIPFPIYLQVLDRDAFTFTTLLIILLFLLELLKGRVVLDVKSKLVILPMLFLVVYFISLFNLNASTLFVELRHYLDAVSSILLYFLILSIVRNERQYKIITNRIIFTVSIQVFISITLMQFGKMQFLEIFATRTSSIDVIKAGEFFRPGGTIANYELLAEWFAITFIFGLFLKNYNSIVIRKFTYPVLILMLIGILVSLTRGALISLFLGLLLYSTFYPGRRVSKNINVLLKIAISFTFLIALVYFLFPIFFENYILRLNDAYYLYESGADVFAIMNRSGVFAQEDIPLQLFGTGKLFEIGSFHSLYLTLLYQTGILGLVAIIYFSIVLLKRILIKIKTRDLELTKRIILLISFTTLSVMLIDQFKIEYQRLSATYQFAWLIFGLAASSLNIANKSN